MEDRSEGLKRIEAKMVGLGWEDRIVSMRKKEEETSL